MLDFTGLDPSIVAQFWIYFIASFIIGAIIGVLCYKVFNKRSYEIFTCEKEAFSRTKAEYEKKIIDYENLIKEHETLKDELKKNKEYWLYVQQKEKSADVKNDFYQKAADKIKNQKRKND